MGAVRERIPEMGLLRAIGFRQTHIMKLILLEGIAISLIGGSLGAGLSYMPVDPFKSGKQKQAELPGA